MGQRQRPNKSKGRTSLMGDVVRFGGITRLPLDPDVVLREAIGQISSVVVMGYDEDGDIYFASSEADGGNVMWLMELAKKRLLEVVDGNH